MWGVLINPIQEVMPGLTAWFGGKAVSQLFPASLKFWCTLCAAVHKRGSEIHSRLATTAPKKHQ